MLTLSDKIRALAARPEGMRTSDVEGHSVAAVGTMCFKLAAKGQLFKAKINSRTVIFFADRRARDARMDVTFQPEQYDIGHMKADAIRNTRRAPWRDDEPAIVPSDVKVTVCPAYRPRFQEHVMPFVHGGLRCA